MWNGDKGHEDPLQMLLELKARLQEALRSNSTASRSSRYNRILKEVEQRIAELLETE